ncbi:MAG: hypothetical protein AVDCRST_MAG02-958 [uncultured Rubrobacteraceae bacterium]|uniref:Uncharacterized protein n=1 Tax=uncultured Rubrobacteraceae bacterium TaxID=349277 RepID=A0A6J4QXB9_9ACTN|nr:MAG: hypothetical protein AVDCRST_MAG02-958 [uncultured Rubrobacteraceae bacterium]
MFTSHRCIRDDGQPFPGIIPHRGTKEKRARPSCRNPPPSRAYTGVEPTTRSRRGPG